MTESLLKTVKRGAFIFTDKSESKWAFLSFSKTYRHVSLILDFDNARFLVDCEGNSVIFRQMDDTLDLVKLCDKIMQTTHVVECVALDIKRAKKVKDCQPFFKFGLSCATWCRIMSGIELSGRLNWRPDSLARKIHEMDGRTNYKIFYYGKN